MKETFGNSGVEGGFIFLHKNGNSGEVGGLSWNSLRGGGMDIFWNYWYTLCDSHDYFASPSLIAQTN